MGIKYVAKPQGLFVITDEEYNRNDRPLSWPEIRHHDADDAAIFDEDPLKAYIIREWRHSDAQTEHEQSDLLEFHCMTIVFRSGWRERVAFLFTERSVHYPVDVAFFRAEELMKLRDPRIAPFWDLPKADIYPDVRLMGLQAKEALKLLNARLARIQAADAKALIAASPAL